jgi:hypothetical protein
VRPPEHLERVGRQPQISKSLGGAATMFSVMSTPHGRRDLRVTVDGLDVSVRKSHIAVLKVDPIELMMLKWQHAWRGNVDLSCAIHSFRAVIFRSAPMRFVAAAVFALACSSASADVGIGVSAKTDSVTIYIPVKAGAFLFEPYVRAIDRDSESQGTTGLGLPSLSATQIQAHAIGVGMFRLVSVADRFTLYYGGRVARLDEELKSFSGSGINAAANLASPAQVSSLEGHSIAPTLGLQYNVMERLSIGAEIAIERSEQDVISFSRGSVLTTQTSRSEIATTETRADLILRFFF